MLFKNTSDITLKPWKGITSHPIPPGGTFEVAEGYALPQRSSGGIRLPSAVEQVFGGRAVPADPKDLVQWRMVPEKLPGRPNGDSAAGLPTVKKLMSMGFSQGHAEEMVKKHLAELSREALAGPESPPDATSEVAEEPSRKRARRAEAEG